MAHVEDRWMIVDPEAKRVDPKTRKKIRGPRWGKGSRWIAVWFEADGTKATKTFRVKDAAEAHLASVEVELRAGTYIDPRRGAITLRQMAEGWYQEQVHQRATSLQVIRRRLDRTILPTLGDRPLASLDRTAIQAAVTAWSKDIAPSTVRVAYVYLAGICSLAVEERRIPATPCRKINLPPIEHPPVVPMTVARVQALTDALWVPYQRMAVLAAASGLRSGELRGLTWDRVTITDAGAQLRIDRQLTSVTSARPTWGPLKTESSVRTVTVGCATARALGEPGDGLVLTTGRGGAITRGMASTAWRAAGAKIGLDEGTGWHELRHFHASLLIAGGSSPVAVAHRLGHKNPQETLATYAHLWVDDEDRMRTASDGVVGLPGGSEPPESHL